MGKIVIGPDEGERVERVSRRYRILCELPALEVIEAGFGPDFEGVNPHAHTDHADCFYIVDGTAEFTVDGETIQAGAGSFIGAPIGTTHSFRNPGPGGLRILNLHAPNVGFAERLRRRAAVGSLLGCFASVSEPSRCSLCGRLHRLLQAAAQPASKPSLAAGDSIGSLRGGS